MTAKAKGATKATPKKAAQRRTRATVPPGWHAAFLADLAANGNITEAARVARVNRNTAYEHRAKDAAFAAAWDEAVDQAVEALELEVRRRALHGVSKPVFYQGEECGRIQEYSDTLAMFLLKALRPKVYRDSAAGTPDDPAHVKHLVEYVNDWRRAGRDG